MADEKDIRIKIIVDTKDAKKLNEVKDALGNVGKEAINASSEIKQAFESITSAITKMSDKTKDINNVTTAVKNSGKNIKKTSGETEEALQDITSDMTGMWKEAEKLSRHWKVSLEEALPYVDKFGEEFKSTTQDTFALAQAAEKVSGVFKVSVEETYAALKKLGVGFDSPARGADKLAKKAVEWGKNFGIPWQEAYVALAKMEGESTKVAMTVAHDTSEMGKSARAFARDWNVSLDSAAKAMKKVYTETAKAGNSFKLPQNADKFTKEAIKWSEDWGVSWQKAYLSLAKMEGESTKTAMTVAHDTSEMGVAARQFAKNWNVSLDSAAKHIKRVSTETINTADKVGEGSKQIGYHLTFIAWHFRYLGNIFDKMSQSLVNGMKDVIKVAAELQESFLSIGVAAAMYGQDMDKATALAEKLAFTGLLPLKDAMSSVQNLMLTKMGFPEMEKLLYRALDVAFLYESGVDGMQEALEGLTKSILRGQTVLAKNVTLRTLWTESEKHLKDTMGLTMKEISKRQRALEVLNTIEREYGATLDLHKIEIDTARGALNRLNTAFTVIKNTLGTALIPLLDAFTGLVVKASGWIKGLINAMGPLTPIIMTLAIGISFLVAKISMGIGIILSLSQVIKGLALQAGIASISLWKILLPVAAIGAVIGVGIYLWLKYSGALDKAKNSASKFSQQLAELQNKVNETMGSDDAVSADEDRRIQHQRTTEDIMEDLERERSKGLWANQMTIRDLEKRLKRENEDWARYLSGIEAASDGTDGVGGIFSELTEEIDAASSKVNIFVDMLKDPKTWGGVGIAAAVFFIASFIKSMLTSVATGGIGFLAATGVGAKIGAALGAGAVAAFGVLVVAGTALAIAALVKEISSYRAEMNSLWDDTDEIMANDTKLITELIKQFKAGEISAENLQRRVDLILNSTRDTIDAIEEAEWHWTDIFGGIPDAFGRMWRGEKYQTGGIVPGLRDQPQLAMVHGGERIIPAGQVGGSSGGAVTININNPIVREQQDINRLAQAVSNVLGQKSRWNRLGAY